MSFAQKVLVLLVAAALAAAGAVFVLQGRGGLPKVEGETTVLDKIPGDLGPARQDPAASDCSVLQNCPREYCYRGPSRCMGGKDSRMCTRDVVCRPKGYDPNATSGPSRSPAPIP